MHFVSGVDSAACMPTGLRCPDEPRMSDGVRPKDDHIMMRLKFVKALLCFFTIIGFTTHVVAAGEIVYQALSLNTAKKFEFLSQNCTGFGSREFKCTDLKMMGYLFEPENSWDKIVIVAHGSGGHDPRHFEYADALIKNGMAALVLDHFGPRNVTKAHKDFVGSEAKGGSSPSMASDAIWAAEALRTQYSNLKSIGFMGESMGGGAALFLTKSWMYTVFDKPPFTDKLQKRFSPRPFNAIASLYGGCFEKVDGERFVDVPLLMLLGEKDDNTPAQLCVTHSDWINTRGGVATAIVLPGEHHDFDAPFRKEYFPQAQNPAKCHQFLIGTEIILSHNKKSYPRTYAGQSQKTRDCLGWGVTGGHQGNKFIGAPHWLTHFKKFL